MAHCLEAYSPEAGSIASLASPDDVSVTYVGGGGGEGGVAMVGAAQKEGGGKEEKKQKGHTEGEGGRSNCAA